MTYQFAQNFCFQCSTTFAEDGQRRYELASQVVFVHMRHFSGRLQIKSKTIFFNARIEQRHDSFKIKTNHKKLTADKTIKT